MRTGSKSLSSVVVCAIVCFSFLSQASGKVVYVATSGSDNSSGLSWQEAKNSVTGGLAVAESGDQVWVAAGTYYECINLKNGVSLYGGFTGTEYNLSQRNWQLNVTIFDGQRLTSVVRGASFARIDGFTIRNGTSPGGGGIRCDSNTSLVITNNFITANWTNSVNLLSYNGGGISCNNSTVLITNNIISGNTAFGGGGGIGLFDDNSTISNNIISGNSAYGGGAIYCRGTCSTLITNNTIVGNTSSVINRGAVNSSSSTPITLANNIIAFNGTGISAVSAVLRNNCVYNSTYNYYLNLSAGTTDIQQDPLLIDRNRGNFHLSSSSPCIDSGNEADALAASLDIDGEARINLAHVDIGADEWYSNTPAMPSPTPTVTPTPTLVQRIVYVSPAGNDNNSGSSWSHAKKTITAGINVQGYFPGLNNTVVWVAAGIYYENVNLVSGRSVYGGFAGNESNISQRNFIVNKTIIDGQNQDTVVTADHLQSDTRIDGFVIRNGVSKSSYGGGISCDGSHLIIANNVITGNSGKTATAGGAIGCNGGVPEIINNKIFGNSGDYYGTGGIYCQQSNPVIAGNVISVNAGNYSGGIYCVDSIPLIINNTICGNNKYTYYANDPNRFKGAAISCTESSPGRSNPLIINNIIAFNNSGIHINGLAAVVKNNCVYNDNDNYSGVSAGPGDISADPKLQATEYADFHLLADSPCIDAGNDYDMSNPCPDIDNGPRIYGSHVDIGADEFTGTTGPFTPAVIYVSQTGNDANNGSSWLLAKRTVQSAIDAAMLSGSQVWVAKGIYNERINLKVYAYIYGGFNGNESTISQRDWNAHETILDGQQQGPVVTGIWWDDGNSRVDGFTIRKGAGKVGSEGETIGAGIYCYAACPTISNNKITFNNADFGAAIFMGSASLIFNNLICGNSSWPGPYGGVIYCSGPACIVNNTITGNTGTGITWWYSVPTIANNIVAFNGSGICAYPGYDPSQANLFNNCVYNPGGNNYINLSAGTGDIWVDPLFADRTNYDFHLTLNSPCIDQGNDTYIPADALDMDGENRKNSLHVDMGADEHYRYITGKVILTEYDPLDACVPVAVKMQVKDLAGNVVRTQKSILHADGGFNVYGISPGQYRLAIKPCAWMQKTVPLTKPEGLCNLGEVVLQNGDLHGDNECYMTSLSIVLASFGRCGDELPPQGTPTPTPTPGGPVNPITATIVLGDYDPLDPEVPVAVMVQLLQNGWPIWSQNLILDSANSGLVTIPNVPPGEYDVAIKACTWMQKVIHVVMPSAAYDLGQIELTNGDMHGDNECFFTSLSIVLKQFGQMGDDF